ncbi:sensor histidine kinase [Deinococcus yavapaiensis]|uniref:histidine kinase n=1 Tax=Deinococcus yavapaiensis KR-236 TaxID=694435 RepID=A0A318S520_9DEIO|nr:GAF domain-containing protein [Deinococcus yavapaiensis]PYE53774.1 PAS domain S-box-containing protein [Deinococcus yavapaiensis KR-236]
MSSERATLRTTLFSDELQTVSVALAAPSAEEQISEIVLHPAIEHLGAIAGGVLLVSAAGDRLDLVARQGYEDGAQTIWQDGPIDARTPATDALRTREALFFEHVDALKAAYPDLERQTGAVSPVASAVLPFVFDGHTLGVLVLDFHEPHAFTPAEKQFLRTLAAQSAVALERASLHARLLGEQQQKVEILESISDAFYAVDFDWRFTYINRRTEYIWGRKREELLGKVYWNEFPQAVGSEPYHAHFEAMRERRVVRLEAMSPIVGMWVDITIYPTQGGVSVYFKDISERKRIEARLYELNRVLERRVEERTRDLQDLNAELRAYAMGISRDLAEPMRRVHGFVGLLERRLADQVDDRVQALFAQVRDEARRVEGRMDELRQLALLERRELREELIALDQLVVQVRSDLESLLKGRKVKWLLGTLPTVMGDALLLRQVLAELLAFALDATREVETALIEVDGETRGGQVVAWVRHNGAALSAQEAQQLFEVFGTPQAESSGTVRIGLANARRIVSRHGGQLWAQSASDGAGGVLFLALPDKIGAPATDS